MHETLATIDDVAALEQRRGGGEAQPVDLAR